MEEDLKKIEEFIEGIEECGLNDCGKKHFDFNLLRNLLKEYKREHAENIRLKFQDIPYLEGTIKGYKDRVEELKENNRAMFKEQAYLENKIKTDYIPKSKVKEKIEELDKEYKDILSDYGNIDTDVVINIPNENVRKHCEKLVEKIIVLQELLEKRK